MIACTCPGCGKQIKAGDHLAGRRVKCPGCGAGVSIPVASSSGAKLDQVIAPGEVAPAQPTRNVVRPPIAPRPGVPIPKGAKATAGPGVPVPRPGVPVPRSGSAAPVPRAGSGAPVPRAAGAQTPPAIATPAAVPVSVSEDPFEALAQQVQGAATGGKKKPKKVVKSGGNRKPLLVGAALVVLGGGGWAAWHFGTSKTNPPEVAQTDVTTPNRQPGATLTDPSATPVQGKPTTAEANSKPAENRVPVSPQPSPIQPTTAQAVRPGVSQTQPIASAPGIAPGAAKGGEFVPAASLPPATMQLSAKVVATYPEPVWHHVLARDGFRQVVYDPTTLGVSIVDYGAAAVAPKAPVRPTTRGTSTEAAEGVMAFRSGALRGESAGAMSPDGKRFAYVASAGFDGPFAVVVDGAALPGKYVNIAGSSLTFSPDSRRFGFIAARQHGEWVAVIDGVESKPFAAPISRDMMGEREKSVPHIRFSPDSRHVAVAGQSVTDNGDHGSTAFVQVDGVEVGKWTWVADVAWSPDSKRLALLVDVIQKRGTGGHEFQLILDQKPGAKFDAIPMTFQNQLTGGLQFSPDSAHVAFVAAQSPRGPFFVAIDGVAGKEYSWINPLTLRYTPEGKITFIGGVGTSNGAMRFNVPNSQGGDAGRPVLVIDGMETEINATRVVISPDGKRNALVFWQRGQMRMENRVRVDGVAHPPHQEIENLQFSLDSRRLLYTASDEHSNRTWVFIDGREYECPLEGDIHQARFTSAGTVEALISHLDQIRRVELALVPKAIQVAPAGPASTVLAKVRGSAGANLAADHLLALASAVGPDLASAKTRVAILEKIPTAFAASGERAPALAALDAVEGEFAALPPEDPRQVRRGWREGDKVDPAIRRRAELLYALVRGQLRAKDPAAAATADELYQYVLKIENIDQPENAYYLRIAAFAFDMVGNKKLAGELIGRMMGPGARRNPQASIPGADRLAEIDAALLAGDFAKASVLTAVLPVGGAKAGALVQIARHQAMGKDLAAAGASARKALDILAPTASDYTLPVCVEMFVILDRAGQADAVTPYVTAICGQSPYLVRTLRQTMDYAGGGRERPRLMLKTLAGMPMNAEGGASYQLSTVAEKLLAMGDRAGAMEALALVVKGVEGNPTDAVAGLERGHQPPDRVRMMGIASLLERAGGAAAIRPLADVIARSFKPVEPRASRQGYTGATALAEQEALRAEAARYNAGYQMTAAKLYLKAGDNATALRLAKAAAAVVPAMPKPESGLGELVSICVLDVATGLAPAGDPVAAKALIEGIIKFANAPDLQSRNTLLHQASVAYAEIDAVQDAIRVAEMQDPAGLYHLGGSMIPMGAGRAWVAVAGAYQRAGNLAGAQQAYGRAAELALQEHSRRVTRNDNSTWAPIAMACVQSGDLKGAIWALSQETKRALPGDVLQVIASAQAKAGDVDGAIQTLGKADFEGGYGYVNAAEALIRELASRGDYRSAIRVIQSPSHVRQGREPSYEPVLSAAAAAGDAETVIKNAGRLDWQTAANLAQTRLAEGDQALAKVLAERAAEALAAQPGSMGRAAGAVTVARLFERLGAKDEAIIALSLAVPEESALLPAGGSGAGVGAATRATTQPGRFRPTHMDLANGYIDPQSGAGTYAQVAMAQTRLGEFDGALAWVKRLSKEAGRDSILFSMANAVVGVISGEDRRRGDAGDEMEEGMGHGGQSGPRRMPLLQALPLAPTTRPTTQPMR